MDSFEENLNTLKRIALTTDDKARVRTHLVSYIKNNPRTTPVHSFGLLYRVGAMAFAVVLIIGGVAQASEGALPGEILYGIKIGVNEKVRSWFAVSPESEADFELSLTEKRLEEAETLAAQGKLYDGAKNSIEEKIQEHANSFGEKLDALSKAGNEDAGARKTEFAGTLDAHKEVLNALSGKNPESKTVISALEKKIAEIAPPDSAKSMAAGVQPSSRAFAKANTFSRDNSKVKDEKEKAKLFVVHDRAIEKFTAIKNLPLLTGSSTTALTLRAALEKTNIKIAQGTTLIEKGNYDDASRLFREVNKTLETIRAIATVAKSTAVDVKIQSNDDVMAATAPKSISGSPDENGKNHSNSPVRIEISD